MIERRPLVGGLRFLASIFLVASVAQGALGFLFALTLMMIALGVPYPPTFPPVALGKLIAAHMVFGVVGLLGLAAPNSQVTPIYVLATAVAVLLSVWIQRSTFLGSAVLVADVGLIGVVQVASRSIDSSEIAVHSSLATAGALLVLVGLVVAEFVPVELPVDFLGGREIRLAQPGRFAAPALVAAVVVALSAGPIAETLPATPSPFNSPFQWSAGGLGGPALRGHPGLGGRLDAGDTPFLDDEIVLRVKSDEPMYWRGITYDSYDGRYWRDLSDARPYTMSGGGVTLTGGRTDTRAEERLVTFTLERSGLDVFLAPDQLMTLYYEPFRGGWDRNDNSIRPDEPLGAGAQWTVRSSIVPISASELRASPEEGHTPATILESYGSEDDISAETIALAASITEGATTRFDKVTALEDWFDANVEYTRDVPNAPDGIDPVDRLLFDTRVGYCEQIATAMAVMLRSQGIPTRIAVGYVPAEFDEKTEEWISRGRDAHAWTEVYFPGVGWQGFDPTSGVPLAGEETPRPGLGENDEGDPSLGERWVDLLEARSVLVGLVGGTGVVVLVLVLVIVRRPRTSERATAQWRLDHMGRRLELDWQESATLRDRIDDLRRCGIEAEVLDRVQRAVEYSQFGPEDDRAAKRRISGALDELEHAIEQRVTEIADIVRARA